MKFSVFQLSRIGGRAVNEDRMGYCYTRESGLFVLADGMGGHPEGEVAAQIALDTISALYQKEAKPMIGNPAEFLASAALAAHHRIIRHASQKGMLDTPRTTLVAAVVQGASASWVHCGDSRLYLVRDGKLLMRTRDHSLLEQSRAGLKALEPVNRNILFTCLGSPAKPTLEIAGPFALQQGDKLMLCSDGLWDSLNDAEIVAQLSSQSVSIAVPAMVESALLAGGEHSDNVTTLAMEWETPDVFESIRHDSAETVMDCSFASTLDAGGLDSESDDLDDAMIERSIAEINAAILRSTSRKA
ncbi:MULTISPECIES: PP2C family serine/threonine-protein phosphatase [unclassified Polaromonas]|jgi:serine/threonine protein phosphatase PrpC|uniref:PP2C family protein-serine/threonine phosphatase n=1 Tax=unclassified Polaromonas TaxID=2638319 RepID=UPI0018CA98D5|nr:MULTISPECIES: protein phosphatase 2C domain-containing protein [unclassified Polaromonas]MBG6071027.1 serine/threonine protein phosphatase PrpC [Polaromonas sp. CG_9.7]MBG6112663.1 serine/threonine protein phosphatase PrpC [Polaromonas sp. CG_9.2]MDH6186138.1 serine/threonine protein phosphatase PrpC [Polaromonas sp. CG_23.6]